MIVISRRSLLTIPLLAGPALSGRPAAADDRDGELRRGVAALERRHGGRLGVAVLDTAGTKPIAHRGNERFPLCSTFKCLAAAFVLARVDREEESLTRRIVYPRDTWSPYSPITEKHRRRRPDRRRVCAAAVTLSDNTAGNLMLDSFGGPAGLTPTCAPLGTTSRGSTAGNRC